jgi:hypothetical protein
MKLLAIALVLALLPQDPAIEKAKKTLEKSPEDPAANLTLAIHYADRGKWEVALQHFEKAKSADIRAAIEAEKKIDGNQFTSVEIGDAWAKAMTKAGPARQACFDRMNFHYAAAWEKLDAFGQTKLKERLVRLYTPTTPAKGTELPKGWGGPVDLRAKAAVLSTRVRSGAAALRLTPSGVGLSSCLNVEVNLPKGATMEFAGWVSTDGTDTTRDGLGYTVFDKERKPVLTKGFMFKPDTFIWTRIGDEVAIPDGAFSVRVEVLLGSAKGFVWLDDLSIKVDGKEVLNGGSFEGK